MSLNLLVYITTDIQPLLGGNLNKNLIASQHDAGMACSAALKKTLASKIVLPFAVHSIRGIIEIIVIAVCFLIRKKILRYFKTHEIKNALQGIKW